MTARAGSRAAGIYSNRYAELAAATAAAMRYTRG